MRVTTDGDGLGEHGGAGRAPAVPGDTAALRRLLGASGTLAADDPRWPVTSAEAQRVTARLAEAGLLAPALVATPADPPVVVARLLLRAWLELARPLPCGERGRFHPWASTATAVG